MRTLTVPPHFLKGLQKVWMQLQCYLHYHCAHFLKKYYPCKLISEQFCQKTQSHRLGYRILGKASLHYSDVNSLIENRALLAQFHPLDALKIGAIAMAEALGNETESAKNEKSQEIIRRLFQDSPK